MNYTNWNDTQPDDQNGEDCAIMLITDNNNKWADADCNGKSYNFVCNAPNTTDAPTASPSFSPSKAPTPAPTKYPTPSPVQPNGYPYPFYWSTTFNYVWVNHTANWWEASFICQEYPYGTGIASIHSIGDNTEAFDICKDKNCWIGGTDIPINTNGWQWHDTTPWDYTNWINNNTEPQFSFSCNKFNAGSSEWINADCDDTHLTFVCNGFPTPSPTQPSPNPTSAPTLTPTVSTNQPSNAPSLNPTAPPTLNPTLTPTFSPTMNPTLTPTKAPSDSPTQPPSIAPSISPTITPSAAPTELPTTAPSTSPTITPSAAPTKLPSNAPTYLPTVAPSDSPTQPPSLTPSLAPTIIPSAAPSELPTTAPSISPTQIPSGSPSQPPTISPSISPTFTPSSIPTYSPSSAPSPTPTSQTSSPTNPPTSSPSSAPSPAPTSQTSSPTNSPTSSPIAAPTYNPSPAPTGSPTLNDKCVNMAPICTSQGLQFTALNTAYTASAGNNYHCLSSQPDPTWYYLKISDSSQNLGDLYMSLSASRDIDFIVYGPFPNLASAISTCGSLGMGNSGFNGVEDCSYSGTSSETPHLSDVRGNEIYVLLITNYAQIVQTVSLALSSGSTAFTDCAIIPTKNPTPAPTKSPLEAPTNFPTHSPIISPTHSPVQTPSNAPSYSPIISPTYSPVQTPSNFPTHSPIISPTHSPIQTPSNAPSYSPIISPTHSPVQTPSNAPSYSPVIAPTYSPTTSPSIAPTTAPTYSPTKTPTDTSSPPTAAPSIPPTNTPSMAPTGPSINPTRNPTMGPTEATINPTQAPTAKIITPIITANCATNRDCYDVNFNPLIDAAVSVTISGPYVNVNTFYEISFIPNNYPCDDPQIDFKYEPIDSDSSSEYIKVYDTTNTPIATCTGGTNQCNIYRSCLSRYNLNINQFPVNTPSKITLERSREIHAFCSSYHSFAINASLTLRCGHITANPTQSTSVPTPSPTNIPSKAPSRVPTVTTINPTTSEPTTLPTADPTADPTVSPTLYPTVTTLSPTTYNPTNSPTPYPTLALCAGSNNRWCYYKDMTIGNIAISKSFHVNITNTPHNFGSYYDIYFRPLDVDCINPSISVQFERIDYNSNNEYINIYDDGHIIKSCGGISSRCGITYPCLTQYSLPISRIKTNEYRKITLFESAAVDSYCSHPFSINATVTMLCNNDQTTNPTPDPTKQPTKYPTYPSLSPTTPYPTDTTYEPTEKPSTSPSAAPTRSPLYPGQTHEPTSDPTPSPTYTPVQCGDIITGTMNQWETDYYYALILDGFTHSVELKGCNSLFDIEIYGYDQNKNILNGTITSCMNKKKQLELFALDAGRYSIGISGFEEGDNDYYEVEIVCNITEIMTTSQSTTTTTTALQTTLQTTPVPTQYDICNDEGIYCKSFDFAVSWDEMKGGIYSFPTITSKEIASGIFKLLFRWKWLTTSNRRLLEDTSCENPKLSVFYEAIDNFYEYQGIEVYLNDASSPEATCYGRNASNYYLCSTDYVECLNNYDLGLRDISNIEEIRLVKGTPTTAKCNHDDTFRVQVTLHCDSSFIATLPPADLSDGLLGIIVFCIVYSVLVFVWALAYYISNTNKSLKTRKKGEFKHVISGSSKLNYISYISDAYDTVSDFILTADILSSANTSSMYGFGTLSIAATIIGGILFLVKFKILTQLFPAIQKWREERDKLQDKMEKMINDKKGNTAKHVTIWAETKKTHKMINRYLAHIVMYDLFAASLENSVQCIVLFYIQYHNDWDIFMWLKVITSLFFMIWAITKAFGLRWGFHQDSIDIALKPKDADEGEWEQPINPFRFVTSKPYQPQTLKELENMMKPTPQIINTGDGYVGPTGPVQHEIDGLEQGTKQDTNRRNSDSNKTDVSVSQLVVTLPEYKPVNNNNINYETLKFVMGQDVEEIELVTLDGNDDNVNDADDRDNDDDGNDGDDGRQSISEMNDESKQSVINVDGIEAVQSVSDDGDVVEQDKQNEIEQVGIEDDDGNKMGNDDIKEEIDDNMCDNEEIDGDNNNDNVQTDDEMVENDDDDGDEPLEIENIEDIAFDDDINDANDDKNDATHNVQQSSIGTIVDYVIDEYDEDNADEMEDNPPETEQTELLHHDDNDEKEIDNESKPGLPAPYRQDSNDTDNALLSLENDGEIQDVMDCEIDDMLKELEAEKTIPSDTKGDIDRFHIISPQQNEMLYVEQEEYNEMVDNHENMMDVIRAMTDNEIIHKIEENEENKGDDNEEFEESKHMESAGKDEIKDSEMDGSTQSSDSRIISKIFEESQGDGYDFMAQIFGKMMNNDDINHYVQKQDESSSDSEVP